MIDYGREMTADRSCTCGRYGAFAQVVLEVRIAIESGNIVKYRMEWGLLGFLVTSVLYLCLLGWFHGRSLLAAVLSVSWFLLFEQDTGM